MAVQGGCGQFDVAVDHDTARRLERGASCGALYHNITDRHWKAVLKIMAYLHGTRGMGLTFVRGSGLDLTASSDADYADKSNDRRSVSGTVITLGGAAFSLASSSQKCVLLSTAEAEYVALGEGVKEALFTGALLSFLCPELRG